VRIKPNLSNDQVYWRSVGPDTITNRSKSWHFDSVIDNQDNAFIYDVIGKSAIKNIPEGFNACIIAYGQTGSGKTHTLLGKVDDEGIAKRAVRHLFDLLDESHQNIFLVSYMEIYLEKLRDLLHKDGSAKLEITKRGEAVKNLSEHIVTSPKDIFCR